jgi:hypothetical protein
MKLRVTLNAATGGAVAVELEASGYLVDQRLGTLTIGSATETLVVYAAGVWRSIADVGALAAATAAATPKAEVASENPRGREKARQAPAP